MAGNYWRQARRNDRAKEGEMESKPVSHQAAWQKDVRIRIRPGRPDSGVKLYVTDHNAAGAHEFMANTRFFRYPALFDALTRLLAGFETGRPLRVCIVPLSVGLEAVSFIISGLRQHLFDTHRVGVEGFDISAKATELARSAIYPRLFFPDDLSPYDGLLREMPDGFVAVEGAITKYMDVLPANDIFEFAPDKPYDLVVCLNLLMHVAEEDKARLVGSLAAMTALNGILCLNNNQEWPGELVPYYEALTAPGGGFISLHEQIAGAAGGSNDGPDYAVTDANAMILKRTGP
ncbi:MAG: hypothetical protein LJE67_12530 [Salaquimonas sp.]|nr:hypothetical protein [Salaquimonas sp.]